MAAGMKKSMTRSKSLATRGNVALAATIAPVLFLAAAVAAADWTPLHSWLTVLIAALALASLACRALATLTRPDTLTPGDSPGVSHPVAVPFDTRLEVGK